MPKWAIAVASVLMCALASSTAGLIVYIFSSLTSNVSDLAKDIYAMRNKMALLEIQIETNNRICRFPNREK